MMVELLAHVTLTLKLFRAKSSLVRAKSSIKESMALSFWLHLASRFSTKGCSWKSLCLIIWFRLLYFIGTFRW